MRLSTVPKSASMRSAALIAIVASPLEHTVPYVGLMSKSSLSARPWELLAGSIVGNSTRVGPAPPKHYRYADWPRRSTTLRKGPQSARRADDPGTLAKVLGSEHIR